VEGLVGDLDYKRLLPSWWFIRFSTCFFHSSREAGFVDDWTFGSLGDSAGRPFSFTFFTESLPDVLVSPSDSARIFEPIGFAVCAHLPAAGGEV